MNIKNFKILITFLLHSALLFQAPCKAFVMTDYITDYINVFAETVKTYFMVTTGKPQELEAVESYFDNKIENFSVKNILKTKCTIKLVKISTFISKHTPFVTHMQLLQELKERFRALQEQIESNELLTDSPAADVPLTQTEAYLKHYKSEIDSVFGSRSCWVGGCWTYTNELETHKELIDQVIAKEKELCKTHYFFYHAHRKDYIILQDFIKLLNGYMNLICPRSDFACMRIKDIHAIPYKNVNEYLDAHTSINDDNELTRSQMISVNLSLFGSHFCGGECTFSYFLENSSISWASLHERLSPIFTHYNFDTKYLKELTDLKSYLDSSTGNLLQICIPHDMVDDLVYLSEAWGKPYNTVVLSSHFDYHKKRHTSIRPLIEYMRTAPSTSYNFSRWQARLMFFDPILDMHPKIKVFRYNGISPENMALYQEKLKDIVLRLVIDHLKSSGINNIKPMARLHNYLNQELKHYK